MLPQRGLSTPSGAVSLCAFLCAILYAVLVQAACGCFGCLSGASCGLRTSETGDAFSDVTSSLSGLAHDEAPRSDFRIGGRWTRGATPGGVTTATGDPVTLTWGLVRDGATLPNEEQDDGTFRRDPSDLISFLDTNLGSPRDTLVSDPQLKSWFPLFEQAYDRWSELSGITFNYEPNDDGVPLSGSTAASRAGVLGVRADMRVAGHFIDGQTGGNTLAYNWFPSAGDMVIDTSNTSFYSNSGSNYRRLRNVLMHEVGHGLGFRHLESSNSGQLMEPFISTAFDGPQIDDILAAHRNYGDVHEKNGGNNSLRSADPIGPFGDGDTWAIGTDGSTSVVSTSQTDFISIDDNSDLDHFVFTVTEPSLVDVRLTQVGRTYNEGPQDGTQTTLNTSLLNELQLELLAFDSGGVLTSEIGATVSRTRREISQLAVFPGRDYYVKVSGTENNVQLYRLDLGFVALPIPEPNTVALALLAAIGLAGTRRAA